MAQLLHPENTRFGKFTVQRSNLILLQQREFNSVTEARNKMQEDRTAWVPALPADQYSAGGGV